MGKKRMTLITALDISALKFILDAAKTKAKTAEWIGVSANCITKWLTGEEYEVTWKITSRNIVRRLAKELDPEPVMSEPRVAVFNKLDLYQQAMDIANMVNDVECERDALRLALRLKAVGE